MRCRRVVRDRLSGVHNVTSATPSSTRDLLCTATVSVECVVPPPLAAVFVEVPPRPPGRPMHLAPDDLDLVLLEQVVRGRQASPPPDRRTVNVLHPIVCLELQGAASLRPAENDTMTAHLVHCPELPDC